MIATTDRVKTIDFEPGMRPRDPAIRFRHYRGLDEDIPGMVAVVAAARLADDDPNPVTLEGMRAQYAHLERSDPATDICIVERAGEIVGFGRVEWADTNDRERYYDSTCVVAPAVRRAGVGRALLAWTERRRREIAAEHASAGEGLDRPRWLTTGNDDEDRGGDILLRDAGYVAFRTWAIMARPNLDDIQDAPLAPGIEIRPIDPKDGRLLRQVFDADTESFRDHFGWVDGTDDAFAMFMEDPGTDPTLWVVAFDGDEVAAAVLNGVYPDPQVPGTKAGWLDSVFTRRAWRRRGLARALIAESLRRLKARGLTKAFLGVDEQNPNQAPTLYERSGFRVVSSGTVYRKALDS